MTEQEIRELPKVWVIGGDGALGDIGFQNVSKVILQNRPNVKMLMLDTQVYSNTGGQNSDSSTMLGGYDMNQFGVASQGKLIEKKNVAEAFTSGHGSPFVAQVSMANAAKLYKAHARRPRVPRHGLLPGLHHLPARARRGRQHERRPGQAGARRARDAGVRLQSARAAKPRRRPSTSRATRASDRDWWRTKFAASGEDYNFTVAHWAITEGRFRKHVKADQRGGGRPS